MERGYLGLGRIAGIPISLHWSAPVIAYVFCGPSPAAWFCFFTLILVHELGHAFLVRATGHGVVEIAFSGLGGFCRWSGIPTRAETALVAWGGVAAQGALYWCFAVARALGWQPDDPFGWTLLHYMTAVNVSILLFNLLPLPILDGWRAWPLFKLLWDGIREQSAFQRTKRDERKVAPHLRVLARPPDPDPGPEPEAEAQAKEARFQRILEDLTATKVREDED